MRLLECAKIVTTHGIRGEVKIQIITDNLERFNKGSQLYVGTSLYTKEIKERIVIDNFRPFKDMGLLSFNGITNINDVLQYVGKTIFVDTDEVDPEGIYYDDLIGCDVYDGDEFVGPVTDIMEVPQGAILIIDNIKKEKESLVPYVDEFIVSVDIDEKKIIIKSIEGLLW